MAVYMITGKLGSGKTLYCIDKIQTALFDGRRVASNLDLNLDVLLGPRHEAHAIRLPDKPRLIDLEALGYGYPVDEPYDESRFGELVLDECGTWLNTRTFQDKERLQIINWCIHARKYRWHVNFLIQHPDAIDKQLRDMLCEHLVVCTRLDRIKLFKLIPLPKIHQAVVYYGSSEQGIIVDKDYYKGKDLWAAYDTGQVFSDQIEWMKSGAVDMRAMYTQLPPQLTHGRYLPPDPKSIPILRTLFRSPVYLAIWLASMFSADTRRWLSFQSSH